MYEKRASNNEPVTLILDFDYLLSTVRFTTETNKTLLQEAALKAEISQQGAKPHEQNCIYGEKQTKLTKKKKNL